MIPGMEMVVILIIGALMAAYGLVGVLEPAWFWAWLMAAQAEPADLALRQPIFLLGARVLGGIMLIAGLVIVAFAAWTQIPPSDVDGSPWCELTSRRELARGGRWQLRSRGSTRS